MKIFYQYLLSALLLLGSFQTFAQTPIYSSNSSASAVLFLDFDGHTVAGTSWNVNGPIVCGPSNLDATKITQIFNRVAEDYRPFNINVTTDSTKYWSAPANRRMRVVLTITSDWYGSAGGVAYTNSFKWGDNTPCFVFTALLNYNAKNIAEAAAHELGHTLGLRHQSSYDANCVKTAEYNSGVGSGEIGWAPIMGVGYYRNFTVWHNGPNPYGCSTVQSDLDILSNTGNGGNGFGYRADDYANTLNQAHTLSFNNNLFSVNGIIEQNTDVDVFKFSMPAFGRFKLDAIPYNIGTGNTGSNLDLQVELLSGQTVIGVYNPGTLLSSVVDTMLDAGNYTFRIQGEGNMYASEYASLGSYALEAAYLPATALPLRKLELRGLTDGNIHKLNWIIDADETIVKQTLEVSSNGRTFESIADPVTNARSYNYQPGSTGALQYRLNVLFDNGRAYNSNIIALRSNSNPTRPQLYTNHISNNMVIVNSPEVYQYVIADYSGRMIRKGTVTQGASSINISNITNGSYIIQFTNNGNTYVEKFVKQ